MPGRRHPLRCGAWKRRRINRFGEAFRCHTGVEDVVMEPGVAGHCVGALVTRGDGFADPLRTIHAYRRAALATLLAVGATTLVAAIRDVLAG